jgi:hypothetical protein
MEVKEGVACLNQKLNKEILEECQVKISYRSVIFSDNVGVSVDVNRA